MKRLTVTRYVQDPAHCAVASCASIINFYNKEVDYNITKDFTYRHVGKHENVTDDGLDTGEMALLLNYMGFKKVTIISCDINCYDFSWSRLGRKKLVEKLNEAKNKINGEYKDYCTLVLKWLQKYNYDNTLKIDYDFSKYIKQFLNRGKPLICSFHWNLLFRFPKFNGNDEPDDMRGNMEQHAVVIYGYSSKNVWICDSHHKYYKYKLKKYRKGFYTISWENLLTVMGFGDLILPEDYDTNAIEIT